MFQGKSVANATVEQAWMWAVRRRADGQVSPEPLQRTVRAISVAAGLLIWEWAGRGAAGSLTVPPISAVLEALAQRLLDPGLEGYDVNLALLAIFLTTALAGGGAYSLDAVLGLAPYWPVR